MRELSVLAYIDPFSGTILLQAIIAAVIGGVAYFRRGLAALFRKLLRRD